MCIIVSKEKNKRIPSKKILKRCFSANPDGAGFMYTKDDKVMIEKGFLTFSEFYKRLMQVDKSLNLYKKSLVMHFRIGTSGGYSKSACHPFPVTNNINDIQKTAVSSRLGMVHNGIISNFVYGELSDTQNFVKDLVYPLLKINPNFLNNKDAIDLLYKQSGATKLCFLDKNDNITYVGDLITDEGIKYSNTTYKNYSNYSNYSNYIPNFDYYDYDYDYDYDYMKKYKKNNEQYYWLATDEIKELKRGMMYYDEDFSQITAINEDGVFFVDELSNLYEYVDSIKSNKSQWYKLKLIEKNIYIIKNTETFDELQYFEIPKGDV